MRISRCRRRCSYNSINMDGTLMRKAMHADPENYVTSMAPGQYWTWGTHMRGVKGKSPNTINRFHRNSHAFLDVFFITSHLSDSNDDS